MAHCGTGNPDAANGVGGMMRSIYQRLYKNVPLDLWEMRKAIVYIICSVCMVTCMVSDVLARGGGGGRGVGHSSSIGPGTGSHYSSHSVRGYFRKDGTYVAPRHR